ncbi:hypothetical protein G647_02449 [Cladophialophora carrionii CBS 160.54]|uniref:Uncharacterized protein n=1 Tax=Cladophialophora carrionii CBS 160.54 TaxID=1279043 RepID=V9DFN5_9EURO|nr:uncharacterized protein G647_02449 [Cladophialophora carrionii CBS 160.54]ETI25675.1 hypothetical protein G647_02449 [Cladophialophora carrionii CBS 160.54]
MPSPVVPMTTTVVEGCPITPTPNANAVVDNNGMGEQQGGPEGGPPDAGDAGNADTPPMTTLTIPCAESISSLEASVTAWSAASAVSASANTNTNHHAPIPYTFPISFPMTSSAAAGPGKLTLNLVVATAPFNFSVPPVPAPSARNATTNATWQGGIKSMTVVPVALTAMNTGAGGASGVAPNATSGAGASVPVQGAKSGAWSIRGGRKNGIRIGTGIPSIYALVASWAVMPLLVSLLMLLVSLVVVTL